MPKPKPDPFKEIREAAKKKRKIAERKLACAYVAFMSLFLAIFLVDIPVHFQGETGLWLETGAKIALMFAGVAAFIQQNHTTAARIVYNTVTYATRHIPDDSWKVFVMRQLVGLEPVVDKGYVSRLLKELTRPEPEKRESLD